ncbi:MAG TPA: hypothetical protein VFM18_00880 [Methanosarcina sp.]|nr:hypothetical protein [Methanosarcina sp.]
MISDELQKDAKIIANLIAKTDTDDRGILLSHVATILRDKAQNYTASIITNILLNMDYR